MLGIEPTALGTLGKPPATEPQYFLLYFMCMTVCAYMY